jgi:hypothetical protein
MRKQIITLLLALLTLTLSTCHPAYAQRKARAPQDTFGSETPIKQPVSLPAAVFQTLTKENAGTLRGCIARHHETDAALPKYFVASEIDINGDGQPDLIVQPGEFCLQGAHAVPFWIYTRAGARLGPDYELAFAASGDVLRVLKTSTNSYHDLTTAYYTALDVFTTVWQFDGSKYEPRSCTVTTFKPRRTVRISCQQ